MSKRSLDRRRLAARSAANQRRKHRFETLERRNLLAAVGWDGGGDGFSWHDALNWDSDSLPTKADDVFIPTSGKGNIVQYSQGDSSVQSLNSQAGLSLTGGSLAVNGSAVTDQLQLDGGNLAGGAWTSQQFLWNDGDIVSSNVVVTDTLYWDITSSFSTTLDADSSLTLAAGASGSYMAQREATVHGDVIIAGDLTLPTNETFLGSGTIEITDTGVVTRSGSGSQNVFPKFTNDGQFNILEGTVSLRGGNAVGQQDDGVYDVAIGAVLELINNAEGRTLSVLSEITGGGTLVQTGQQTNTILSSKYDLGGSITINRGRLNFDAKGDAPEILLTGGALGGDITRSLPKLTWHDGLIASKDLTITDSLTIEDPTGSFIRRDIETGSTVTIAAGAAATWSGNRGFSVRGDLDIAGSFTMQNDVQLSGSGRVHVLSTGTLTKSASGGLSRMTVQFTNDGEVHLDSGSLALEMGNAPGEADDGAYTIAAGTLLSNKNAGTPRVLTGTSSIVGAGDLLFFGTSSNTTFDSATYAVTGDIGLEAGTVHFNVDAELPQVSLSGGKLDSDRQLKVGRLDYSDGQILGTDILVTNELHLTDKTSSDRRIFGKLTLAENAIGDWVGTRPVSLFGQLDLAGDLDLLGSGRITGSGPINILPSGQLRKTAGGPQQISPPISLSGRIDVSGGQTLRLDKTISQTGGVTNVSGELLLSGSSTQFDLTAGTLVGLGTVTGDVNNSGGTVAPNDSSPGTLTIDGDYTQGSAGTLAIQLGGDQTVRL